jgi:hypothetical protein
VAAYRRSERQRSATVKHDEFTGQVRQRDHADLFDLADLATW